MQGWTLSDQTLYLILRGYLRSLQQWRTWVVDVFTNDITVGVGDVYTDFVLPTGSQWPGYVGQLIPVNAWGDPQVTENVAMSIQSELAVFSLPLGVPAITLYGYLISDGYGNLICAESFATALVVSSPGGVTIQARLNLGVMPIPSMLRLRRPRVSRAVVAEQEQPEE
jgi:hypothetical protein